MGRFYGDRIESSFVTVADFSAVSKLWGADPENDGECEFYLDCALDGGGGSFGGGGGLPGAGLPEIERLCGGLAGGAGLWLDVWDLPWKCGTGNLCLCPGNLDGASGGDHWFSVGQYSVPCGGQLYLDFLLGVRSATVPVERWDWSCALHGNVFSVFLGRYLLFLGSMEENGILTMPFFCAILTLYPGGVLVTAISE